MLHGTKAANIGQFFGCGGTQFQQGQACVTPNENGAARTSPRRLDVFDCVRC
jgi:hypothetical protein